MIPVARNASQNHIALKELVSIKRDAPCHAQTLTLCQGEGLKTHLGGQAAVEPPLS